MSAFASISRALRLTFGASTVAAAVIAVGPTLFGHVGLGVIVFFTSFAVCWLTLGPAFLLVGGAADLSRAVERVIDRKRVIRAREATREAGQLALTAEGRNGELSPAPDGSQT